jgi:hypothetical protein
MEEQLGGSWYLRVCVQSHVRTQQDQRSSTAKAAAAAAAAQQVRLTVVELLCSTTCTAQAAMGVEYPS